MRAQIRIESKKIQINSIIDECNKLESQVKIKKSLREIAKYLKKNVTTLIDHKFLIKSILMRSKNR